MEHPILFSQESIQAILAGRKTETRRVYTGEYGFQAAWSKTGNPILDFGPTRGFKEVKCPYGTGGDLLWVREPWERDGKRKPALFMPKRNARIWLKIRTVSISTLGNMNPYDAYAEGYKTLDAYREAWNSLNKKRGYPWRKGQPVWVIQFEIKRIAR